MEKLYTTKIKVYVALLSMLTAGLSAQLTGVYTINSAVATGGANFQSFSALAAVINTAGISGPVTVNVAPGSGPYVEQVNFTAIAGTSSTNTITINGNGATITFAGAAAATAHTIKLSGTDYLTINNLNIVGTGNNAWALHLWGQASNNQFNNCVITVPGNGTSTNQMPVILCNSNTAYSTTGDSGNNNIWTGCVMNGGYYGVSLIGNTGSPFTTGNSVISCTVADSYVYQIYNYYNQDPVLRGNIIERLNRTTLTTGCGILLNTGTIRALVEGNHIRKLFNASVTNANTAYGIYCGSTASAGNENIIRNNIISDIRSNGPLYGIYNPGYNYNLIYHNTISLDDANSTATGLTRGIYSTSGPNAFMNNIITISRGGTGIKHGIYLNFGTITTYTSDYNVVSVTSTVGSNYTGYWNGTNFATLANWQTANSGAYDKYSSNASPSYNNPTFLDYTPTAVAVNNLGTGLGVLTDFNGTSRSLPTPDPGAIEFFTIPCTGNPALTSITTPTTVFCPGTIVNMNVAGVNNYTNSGYSYQWQTSTVSPIGPFTSVTGATVATYVTPPVNVNTYFTALISCSGGGTTMATAGQVVIAPTVTNSVPYFESFETLGINKLPNCFWSVSNTVTALTQTISNPNGRIPYSGTNFGMFFNSPAGVNHFYTNAIWMDAGVTYSAALWYITESVGYTNWTNLSILVGTGQSPVGSTVVAATPGPAVSPIHKLLSNTFMVGTSGFYYVSVRGTAVSGSAQYLSWDDLSITIPCSLNGPNISLSLNSSTVCSDKPFNITATGADSYLWSTGETNPAITVTPNVATTGYTVTGLNALTGCSSTFIQPITVLPSPAVFIFANNNPVCLGSSANLMANGTGVISYNWSHGVNNQSSVVTPTTTTTYSVMGLNAYGCLATESIQIVVNSLPNVIASASATQICKGEEVVLMGIGASSYNWVSNTSIVYLGNPLVLQPQSSTMFTLTGTDAATGCSKKVLYLLNVDECTGIRTVAEAKNAVGVYPNPANGLFTVESSEASAKIIEVIDLTGRVILSTHTHDKKSDIDIRTLANGIYYVKVQSGQENDVIKVVKTN